MARTRPTWRRTAQGKIEYRFGDTWFDLCRTVRTKTERDETAKKLRSQGYQVRTKKDKQRHYMICKRRK